MDEPKATRKKGGARKVVRITMIIIDTSSGLSEMPLAELIPDFYGFEPIYDRYKTFVKETPPNKIDPIKNAVAPTIN